MDRKSWLWRRKSSEKSPGETESSGSVSSHSERYSDDQELLRASPSHASSSHASPNDASPNNAQSPEVSSNVASCEVNESVKNLTEKLSAALLNISAKEDLVKQHAKVAEEAVSGWEKAETEGAALKQQLETAAQKNSALEDRISHLDGALKECVRQLRQFREEQEQKIHDALIKKTNEWQSNKFELESRLGELQAQLEAATSVDDDLQSKFEAAEKENSALKVELLTLSRGLQMRTLERDLSTQAAETATKQHLESIKKVAKLEAECRSLRAVVRKRSSINDHKPNVSSSIYVESLTDSQSDSAERGLAVDNEPSCSDSWASALIAELDQFKSEKANARNLTASSVDIDLMDDFLEMERLAALPEANHVCSSFELEVDSNQAINRNSPSKAELDSLHRQMVELEEKAERMETEKSELEMALAETRNQLDFSCSQLTLAEDKLVELQRQLDSVNASKQAFETEAEAVEAKRQVLEFQLESANLEVQKLHEKVALLEGRVEEERALSAEIAAKCKNLEDELSKKQEAELRQAAISNGELKIKQEKELAAAAGKLAECQRTIASLGQQLKSLATLEDFMLESEKPEVNGGSPELRGGDVKRLHSSYSSESMDGSHLPNSKERASSPSSSSSSSSSLPGFPRSFPQSRSSRRIENH